MTSRFHAPNALRENAVAHLELPQLHVADELVDNDPPADLALGFPDCLRHAPTSDRHVHEISTLPGPLLVSPASAALVSLHHMAQMKLTAVYMKVPDADVIREALTLPAV